MSTRESIEAFWAYWATVKDQVAEGFGQGGLSEPLVQGISEHVSRIDESLDWEFGPGHSSQHHLCVSSKGDPVLRIVAERWLALAPAADPTWEYHSSRQPHPGGGLALSIADVEVQLDDLKVAFEIDDAREVLDLTLYHPVFSQIEDEELRLRIAFIGLDTLLGEDGVERWVGSIDVALTEPEGAVSLAELARAVERLAQQATEDKWVVLRGEVEGTPIFVSKNAALKRVNHLLLDTHVEIRIALAEPTEEGLTTNEEAEVLNGMEDALIEALGSEAAFIGRETFDGQRTIHLHVMEGGPAAQILDNWRRRFSSYDIEIEIAMDPQWEVLHRWD